MKIRHGFVSNSSSSSFLIALKELPESSEDIFNMIWGGEKICNYYYPGFGHMDMASIILGDILNASHLSEEEALQVFNEGFLISDPPYDYNSDNDKYYSEYCEVIQKHRKEKFEQFKHNNNTTDSTIFVRLEYEDGDVKGSQLEHEVPWEQAPNIMQFNNH